MNLIGEYTDFNGGLVLPLAIDRYLIVTAVPRTNRMLLAGSEATGESAAMDLDGIGAGADGGLGRYVRGMASCLMSLGLPLVDAELRITGDLPRGAGLSSSAALEVAIGHALWALSGVPIDARALALAALRCEHEYVGTQCGPMDPFAVSLGVADHALRLDCRSLDVTPVRLSLGNAELLVCDTGVTHALGESAYNERRAQCEEAVRILDVVLACPVRDSWRPTTKRVDGLRRSPPQTPPGATRQGRWHDRPALFRAPESIEREPLLAHPCTTGEGTQE